jgi:sigma-E factor negative regulatory protein RseB
MNRARALRTLALALLAAGGTVGADEPRDWLARMNQALTTRNYDGTFFHMRDGRVETLRIVHRVQGTDVMERLVSLDGSRREFIRNGNELTCYIPDQRTVIVERRAGDGPLLGNLPVFDERIGSFYDIKGAERTRLMERDARLVEVSPRDAFRYGYRLWIDEKTAMPLKTQLCDGDGKVVEQIIFTSLTLPERIADSEFRPQVAAEGFRWLRGDARAVVDERVTMAGMPALWERIKLPPGFRLMTRASQLLPGSDQPVAHVVFSDGVASVSVFVEERQRRKGDAASPSGATQLGSSSAFSTSAGETQITAVGEVPAATVRMIATQIHSQLTTPDAGPALTLKEAGTGPKPSPGLPAAPAFAPRKPGR